MAEPGRVEQKPNKTPIRIGRRALLKDAAVIGAGVAAATAIAKVTGVGQRLVSTRDQSFGVFTDDIESASSPEVKKQIVPNEVLSISERWFLPGKANIHSPDGAKSIDVQPSIRSILTENGQQIGQVFECTLEANSGDEYASLDFVFQKDHQGDYHVLTNGWQSWSTYTGLGDMGQVIGKRPYVRSLSSSVTLGNTDRLVGIKSFERSLGGKTVPFFEPGPGGEEIPKTEGRSYGWVGFRDMQRGGQGEDIVLGVIPGFDGLEGIKFRQEGENIIVSVTKNLEGVLAQRSITFKIFLGSANPRQKEGKLNYADLEIAFSKELSKQVGNVPLMKDRVIGFSWPAFGPAVTQADIQKEIAAGNGIYDTYIIDDGWETASGSLQIDKNKFPDLPDLAQQIKKAGIKPGIWVAPFKIKEKGMVNLPKEWFMKDKDGNPKKTPLPQPLEYLENSFELDVSVPEFRAYLADRFLDLAKMGFETFKADFLAVPFTGKLQNQDKTSVEYYRQTFQAIRQHIREALGKEIEIIGCGAPMMESIGLFNGMRMSPDSALQNFGATTNRISLSRWVVADMNTGMYHSATTVAARRILPFRDAHGLILDGVHLADEDVPMNPDKRGRLNESILALNRLGIGNLFVGDSLARVGEAGKQAWQDLINVFKLGNVELLLGGKRRPKIPTRFSPDSKVA